MATDTARAPDQAQQPTRTNSTADIQGAFHADLAGSPTLNGVRVDGLHLPLDFAAQPPTAITATVAPPSVGDAGLSHDTLREMYRYVALARALDERIWQLNRAGRAPFVVSGQGHEAALVGAAFALDRERDVLLPYYRDLALCLVFGLTPLEMMLSVLAKAGDPISGGRQMPAHYGSARLRIISGSSVVATQLPQATGVAYAAKLRRTGQVAVVCFGEGAASEGDFHEACNFAGIHRLPVVFFCENNRYAISVPQSQQMAIEHVADRATAYGFPGVVVDGTDALAVHGVMREAAERARRGDGPTLVEAKVYRFQPHTSDDDDRVYRHPDEVRAWKAHDPLGRFESRLREVGALDDDRLAEIRAEIRAEIDAATDAAEAAPFPDAATFDQHVYAS